MRALLLLAGLLACSCLLVGATKAGEKAPDTSAIVGKLDEIKAAVDAEHTAEQEVLKAAATKLAAAQAAVPPAKEKWVAAATALSKAQSVYSNAQNAVTQCDKEFTTGEQIRSQERASLGNIELLAKQIEAVGAQETADEEGERLMMVSLTAHLQVMEQDTKALHSSLSSRAERGLPDVTALLQGGAARPSAEMKSTLELVATLNAALAKESADKKAECDAKRVVAKKAKEDADAAQEAHDAALSAKESAEAVAKALQEKYAGMQAVAEENQMIREEEIMLLDSLKHMMTQLTETSLVELQLDAKRHDENIDKLLTMLDKLLADADAAKQAAEREAVATQSATASAYTAVEQASSEVDDLKARVAAAKAKLDAALEAEMQAGLAYDATIAGLADEIARLAELETKAAQLEQLNSVDDQYTLDLLASIAAARAELQQKKDAARQKLVVAEDAAMAAYDELEQLQAMLRDAEAKQAAAAASAASTEDAKAAAAATKAAAEKDYNNNAVIIQEAKTLLLMLRNQLEGPTAIAPARS